MFSHLSLCYRNWLISWLDWLLNATLEAPYLHLPSTGIVDTCVAFNSVCAGDGSQALVLDQQLLYPLSHF